MQSNIQFKRWSDDEEQQLLKEIEEGKPTYVIAKLHERSIKAINLRLLDMAMKMKNSGINDSIVETKTRCTPDQIKDRISQLNSGEGIRKESNDLSIVLQEIRSLKELILKYIA